MQSMYRKEILEEVSEDREFFNRKFGFELDVENFQDIDLKWLCDDLLSRVRVPAFEFYKKEYIKTKRRIYIGISQRTRAEASSAEGSECDLVQLSIGLITQLFNFYCCILSHPDVFNFIDDGSLENANRLENKLNRSEGNKLIFGSVIPVSRKRAVYAKALTASALDIVVAHELHHLMQGHSRLIEEKIYHIKSSSNSLSPYCEDSNYIFFRKALEINADAGAAQYMMRYMNYNKDEYILPDILTEEGKIISISINNYLWGNIERVTTTISYALYGVFFIARCQGVDKETFHPSVNERMLASLESCAKFVFYNGKLIDPQRMKILFSRTANYIKCVLIKIAGKEIINEFISLEDILDLKVRNSYIEIDRYIGSISKNIEINKNFRINPDSN